MAIGSSWGWGFQYPLPPSTVTSAVGFNGVPSTFNATACDGVKPARALRWLRPSPCNMTIKESSSPRLEPGGRPMVKPTERRRAFEKNVPEIDSPTGANDNVGAATEQAPSSWSSWYFPGSTPCSTSSKPPIAPAARTPTPPANHESIRRRETLTSLVPTIPHGIPGWGHRLLDADDSVCSLLRRPTVADSPRPCQQRGTDDEHHGPEHRVEAVATHARAVQHVGALGDPHDANDAEQHANDSSNPHIVPDLVDATRHETNLPSISSPVSVRPQSLFRQRLLFEPARRVRRGPFLADPTGEH